MAKEEVAKEEKGEHAQAEALSRPVKVAGKLNPLMKLMQAEVKAKEEAEEKEKAEKAKAEAEAAEGKEEGSSLGQRFADLFDLPQVQPGACLTREAFCVFANDARHPKHLLEQLM